VIIDSQVHAYAAESLERPWRTHPNWPDHVTGEEMVAAMDAVGVSAAILVSPFLLYGYDAGYAVEVYRRSPEKFRLVKLVDCADPAVADVVAEWKRTPGTVGIRIRIDDTSSLRPGDPGLDRAMRAAARNDLAVNVLCAGRIDAATELADRHPNTRFVIDHLGLHQHLPLPARPWEPVDQLVELSKRENTAIKLTGACVLSKEPYPFSDIWDPLGRIFDSWGIDRCLWGSDWTRTFPQVGYKDAITPFLLTDRLTEGERAMLMGGACAEAYGWSPVGPA